MTPPKKLYRPTITAVVFMLIFISSLWIVSSYSLRGGDSSVSVQSIKGLKAEQKKTRKKLRNKMLSLGLSDRFAGRILNAATRWSYDYFAGSLTEKLQRHGLKGEPLASFLGLAKRYIEVSQAILAIEPAASGSGPGDRTTVEVRSGVPVGSNIRLNATVEQILDALISDPVCRLSVTGVTVSAGDQDVQIQTAASYGQTPLGSDGSVLLMSSGNPFNPCEGCEGDDIGSLGCDNDTARVDINFNITDPNISSMSLKFDFYSYEFPEFVGAGVNDFVFAYWDQEVTFDSNCNPSPLDQFCLQGDGCAASTSSTGGLLTFDQSSPCNPTNVDSSFFQLCSEIGCDNPPGTPGWNNEFNQVPGDNAGRTDVLTTSWPVTPGSHRLTLLVGDAGDGIFTTTGVFDELVCSSAQVGCATTTNESVDLAVTKTGSPNPLSLGDDLTYRIAVSNIGAMDATGVVLTDTLPPGVNFISSSSGCTESLGVVTCNLGDLPQGSSTSVSIVVRPVRVGTFTNIASVRANESDNNSSNNTASATTTVSPAADIAITKTASPDPLRPGDIVTYTITVTNNRATIADEVVVTDDLPPQLSFISCQSTSGICQGSGNSRSVLFPGLASNQSGVITIRARVNQEVPDGTVISNTASVTTRTNDPDSSNNSATARVNVLTQELGISGCQNQTRTAPEGRDFVEVFYDPAPQATGNRPGASVVCSPPSGSVFGVGPPTQVTCTATDRLGSSATCSFLVTVNPARPPVPVPDISQVIFPRVDVPDDSDPERFTITNPGPVAIQLTFASLLRETDAGRISDDDDTELFTIFEVINGQSREIGPGDTVTPIAPGETREFRVVFKPRVPEVVASFGDLTAEQVLPDEFRTRLTFSQDGAPDTVITLVGRVERGLRLIDPDNASAPSEVTFRRSGNEFILEYSVYDPNLDVSVARYELFDGSGIRVATQEVDLGAAVRGANLVRGQSFTVEQRFTGANSNPGVSSIRLTLTDGESTVTATARLSGSTSSAATVSVQRSGGARLVTPKLSLERTAP